MPGTMLAPGATLVYKKSVHENTAWGSSLVAHWLGVCSFIAEGADSIPGLGTKIPQALQHSKKKKQEERFVDYTSIKLKGKKEAPTEIFDRYNEQVIKTLANTAQTDLNQKGDSEVSHDWRVTGNSGIQVLV